MTLEGHTNRLLWPGGQKATVNDSLFLTLTMPAASSSRKDNNPQLKALDKETKRARGEYSSPALFAFSLMLLTGALSCAECRRYLQLFYLPPPPFDHFVPPLFPGSSLNVIRPYPAQGRSISRLRPTTGCSAAFSLTLSLHHTSCKRRGCSAICPNGSLITGQGTRCAHLFVVYINYPLTLPNSMYASTGSSSQILKSCTKRSLR